jgi:signal transduction histidine kinase
MGGDTLRAAWRAPAPASPPLDRVDVALALLMALAIALELALRAEPAGSVGALVAFALVPTVLLRRRWPLPCLALAFTVPSLVELAIGREAARTPNALAFVLLLPYAVMRWGSGRARILGVVACALVLAGSAAVEPNTPGDVLGGVAVVVTSLVLGANARLRADAEAQARVEIALRERERLARDLYDTVAHHVSAIAIRAQAGRAASAAPRVGAAVAADDDAARRLTAARDALDDVAAEASRTLDAMRALVRVLRDDAPLAPTPGLDALRDLAAARVSGGPDVELSIADGLGEVSDGVATTLFRLAQEAITNARRHARGAAHVRVAVATDGDALTLSVEDDGEPVGAPSGEGHGLRGMRERVALLGGRLVAGPGDARGWVVRASLPRRPA